MNNVYVDSEQLLNCALNLKKDATNILTTFQNECSHANVSIVRALFDAQSRFTILILAFLHPSNFTTL